MCAYPGPEPDVYFNNRAGLPLPGVEIKIIDQDENGIGEIIGRGPNIMLGYYKTRKRRLK